MASTITKDMAEGLWRYKYSCKDTSIFSNYVMHPFWDWVAQFYPRWLAPNILTFTGFLMTVLHYALLTVYNPNFQTPLTVPPWAWLVTSILAFTAHTLDGTDGKQARRTKSSSALGELFDHGCDSWVCLFLPGSLFSLLGPSFTPVEFFFGQWMLLLCFFSSHWEKYITGVLFLPWTFDVTQILVVLIFLSAFLFSPTIFAVPILFGWSLNNLFKFSLYASSIFMQIPITWHNIRADLPPNVPWYRHHGLWDVCRPLIPIALLFGSSCLWVFHSPSNILNSQPRLFFYCFATITSNFTCRFIVAQLCKIRPSINHRPTYIYCFITILICIVLRSHFNQHSEMITLWLMCIYATVDHLRYSIQTVNGIASVLNVSVFKISH